MADNNTTKERLKEITDSIESGIKELFELFMEALKRSSPVPLFFEKMETDKDGYFKGTRPVIRNVLD